MNFAAIIAQLKKYFGEEPAASPRPGIRTSASVVMLMLLTCTAALWSKHFENVHDADSLITSMISTQKLTFFYWGANRFGNLLPFLTAWIHDINLNFEVQVLLRAAGAATIPLFVFSFIGLRRNLLSAYAIALALSLLPFNDEGNSVWVWITPYGHSIPPLWAAWLLQRNNHFPACIAGVLKLIAAFLLVLLAFYVNGGLIIFALPLWFGYAVLFPRVKNWAFVAILAVAYFCYGRLSAHYGLEYHDAYDYSRMTFAWQNVQQFFHTFASMVSPAYFLILAITLAGWLVIQRGHLRNRSGGEALIHPLVLRSILIVPPGLIYLAMFANMDWVVQRNQSAFRYFWFALVLAAPLCVAAITEGIRALREGSQPARDAQSLALTHVIIASLAVALYGTTMFFRLAPFEASSSFVRKAQRADSTALAALAQKYGATYIAGDYYVVWPAVFEAIGHAQRAGNPDALNIRGLGQRGEHLRPEIAANLRVSQRVVVIGANLSPADCYAHALYENAADWPPNSSLLAAGLLPSGASYCVLAFDRNPPAPDAVRLPHTPAIFLMMLNLDPQAAHWDHGKIEIAASGYAQKVWSGPSVNVPAGKYVVAFQIQTTADSATPLFELRVTDGFGSREYAKKTYAPGDFHPGASGTWATIEFTIPDSSPSRVLEFEMTATGKAPFTVTSLDLHRE